MGEIVESGKFRNVRVTEEDFGSYSLNVELPEEVYNSDEYGAKDKFRKIISAMVERVVEDSKWFGFCTRISESQIDIMKIQNDSGVSLGNMVSSIYEGNSYRTAIYKYFIRNYLCYYEVPAVKRGFDSGSYMGSYDKMMITDNLYVVADFLGISLEEAVNKYLPRVSDSYINEESDWFPYLKLVETKEGVRKVVRPRSPLDLGKRGTRVIPLFALDVGVSYLYESAKDECVKVSFRKDGGVDRDIIFTFDVDKVRDVYGNSDFFYSGFEKCYDGDMMKNFKTSEYGYIRVIEMGGSKYDNPCRSVNFARILSVEFGAEPDLTFVNIDTESAVAEFKKSLPMTREGNERLKQKMRDAGIISDDDYERIGTKLTLEEWVDSKAIVAGTILQRSLALFTLGNPMDFPNYTGLPVEYASSGEDSFGLSDGSEGLEITDTFGFNFE